ncbi:uncharacterized protein LTR77_001575 [Saxophila tyrrhenica]|uniref:F-box domain-containing protein n=1 Tax=Saxophila tyrrhenica TaxID=1690608 RepID=A0AAV9PL78_9PEZI|nr:hypothetical protein LTR77_001575 [Saxophila tyrrhenica]
MVHSLQDIFTHNLQASNDRAALASQLDRLTTSLPADPEDASHWIIARMRDLLKDQQEHQASIANAISHRFRMTPRTGELATEVFAISELLEQILLKLDDNQSLLLAKKVNRQFSNVIEGSPELKRQLGLEAERTCHFSMPIAYMAPWNVRPENGKSVLLEHSRNRMWVSFDLPGALKLGSKCHAMLLTQPPVKKVLVVARCCNGTKSAKHIANGMNSHATVTIDAEPGSSGITVGDVNDAIKQFRATHRLCPMANIEDHDKDGFVKVRVKVFAALTGAKGRLIGKSLKAQQERAKEKKGLPGHGHVTNEMYAYAVHKREVSCEGHAIPTLAEFRKTPKPARARRSSFSPPTSDDGGDGGW